MRSCRRIKKGLSRQEDRPPASAYSPRYLADRGTGIGVSGPFFIDPAKRLGELLELETFSPQWNLQGGFAVSVMKGQAAIRKPRRVLRIYQSARWWICSLSEDHAGATGIRIDR